MTVAQLIKRLQKEDPKRIVIMSKDAEGNYFSPLADFEAIAYEAETTWSGHVGFEKLTPALEKQGYTEEDVLTNGKPALILCPVN